MAHDKVYTFIKNLS